MGLVARGVEFVVNKYEVQETKKWSWIYQTEYAGENRV